MSDAVDIAYQMQRALKPLGEPSDDDLQIINSRALKPLTKNDVFVVQTETSNSLRDSYFTTMDPETTLPNFVDDFKEGRSLMNSHRTEELPLGTSFDAALEQRGREGDSNDPARTAAVVKSYILRGININGVPTDDLVRAIEAGVVRDVSVHFDDEAEYRCTICGGDMYERESSCIHMPGLTYGGKRAEALIVDGHALEHSLCFDGATPRAMIDKAQRMAAAGQLDAKQVARLERLYRTRIRSVAPSAGGPPEPGGDRTPTAYEDRQKAIQNAVQKLYPGDDEWAYLDRTTDTDVAWTVTGGSKAGSYQATYSIDDGGKVTLGEPTPVTITTTVTPINRAKESKRMEHPHKHSEFEHDHEDSRPEHDHADTPADRWVELLPAHARQSVEFLGREEVERRVAIAARGRFSLFVSGKTWEKASALERATWSTAMMNDLPDSAFAYIEPGGKKDEEGKTTPRSLRHFPHHDDAGKLDEAHVRNALARIPQSDVSDAAKSSALSHVKAHAKTLGIEVDDEGRVKSNKGGNMTPLDPETFANLAGVRMPVAERERVVDALISVNPDDVTPDLVNRVAASMLKRAGPAMAPDMASQMQGILDQMADAHDAHAEALKALKTLVGIGAEGGMQYGLPDNMASQEDLEPGQAAGLKTLDYGPGATPNGTGNGTMPPNGSIGGGRSRSIAIGNAGANLDAKVKSALGTINGIISDLLATDAQEDEQDVEQQSAEDAIPITSSAIGPGPGGSAHDQPVLVPGRSADHEARARRALQLEAALRAPEFAAIRALVAQAKAGRDYRRAVAGELLAWGVRARGTDFNAELYKRLLPSMELGQIEELTKEFERDAWKRFANAPVEERPDWLPSLVDRVGRQTTPGLLPGTPTKTKLPAAVAAAVNVDLFKTNPW